MDSWFHFVKCRASWLRSCGRGKLFTIKELGRTNTYGKGEARYPGLF